MARKTSLMAAAKKLASSKRRKSIWFDHLEPETRKSLIEIKRAYRAGELDGMNVKKVQQLLKDELGIDLTWTPVNNWLRRDLKDDENR